MKVTKQQDLNFRGRLCDISSEANSLDYTKLNMLTELLYEAYRIIGPYNFEMNSLLKHKADEMKSSINIDSDKEKVAILISGRELLQNCIVEFLAKLEIESVVLNR